MRVAANTSVHAPFDTRIIHKQCCSLARAGHDVTLVAPHDRDDVVGGVKIKSVPGSRHRKVERARRVVWGVYREALHLNADVYHLHDPELIPVGLRLRALGKHVIYDAHEDLPATIATKDYIPRALKTPVAVLSNMLERVAARRLSAIVAATPTIARRFNHINPRTVVIRNYVMMREWPRDVQLAWRDRSALAAYVGGITWERGLREMITAMGQAGPECGARLALAGPYSPPELRTTAATVPGWAYVDDLGVISRAEVASLLGRVQVGLVVLHPTPSYVPSLPIKLFEYMAAGIPSVASDFPVWRGLVEEAACGLLVDPLDTTAIADALVFLLTHPSEAEHMGQAGRTAAEQSYSWESEERTLLDLYAQLEQPCSAAPTVF
jgi:glycosyltransferase involved in cell wall biosynthesis